MDNIKKVILNDIDLLQSISITTFSDTFGKDNSPEDLQNYLDKAYSTEQLSLELNNNNSEFHFIYSNNQLAGYLKTNVDDAQTESIDLEGLEIERIYILSSFKRQGLGNMLFQKALTSAKSLNKKSIWLGVWENNFPAIQFYKSIGFEKVGQHSFFMGTDEQIDFILKKELL